MNHLHRVLLLACFAFYTCPQTGMAQSTDSVTFFCSPSVTFRQHYGFFIANQPKALYVRDSHSSLSELDISFQTNGKRAWEQVNNFPQVGIALLYGRSGSSQYIGRIGALFPYVDFPLYRRHAMTTSFRLGFGLGWVEKPYDKETNSKNLLLSSTLNGCINMGLHTEMQLQKHLYLSAGFSFTHLSNGCFKLPNLGLNIPAVTAGIRYAVQPAAPFRRTQLPSFAKKIHYYIYTYIAGKQTYPLEGPLYMVNTITGEMVKDFSWSGRIGVGLNYTYDHSLSKEVTNSLTFAFDRSQPKSQASAFITYEHVIGNLSIPVQSGVYFYNRYPVNTLYQNIGLRYRLSSHWIAALQLKTHLGKADYIQYGIGYKI